MVAESIRRELAESASVFTLHFPHPLMHPQRRKRKKYRVKIRDRMSMVVNTSGSMTCLLIRLKGDAYIQPWKYNESGLRQMRAGSNITPY